MNDSLEQQLFDWVDWEADNTGDMTFYNITLKVNIGNFTKGTKFHDALWKMTESKLVLVTDEGKEYTFNLGVYIV